MPEKKNGAVRVLVRVLRYALIAVMAAAIAVYICGVMSYDAAIEVFVCSGNLSAVFRPSRRSGEESDCLSRSFPRRRERGIL